MKQRTVRTHRQRPHRQRGPVIVGWFESYSCGCTSPTVRTKRDLLGYCAVHGGDTRQVFPEVK